MYTTKENPPLSAKGRAPEFFIGLAAANDREFIKVESPLQHFRARFIARRFAVPDDLAILLAALVFERGGA